MPTQTALTLEDVVTVGESGARQFWSAGLRPGDFCACWLPPTPHPGSSGMSKSFEVMKVPHNVLTLGAIFQETELGRWSQMMRELPMVSSSLPYSMVLTFRDYIESHNLTPQETLGKMKCIFTYGDLITPVMRRSLEDYWGTELHEIQFSADVMFGFYTCELRDGLHVPEDLFAIEVVDPQTGEPVPMGQPGYLIITPTWTEGTCHLRWNSEDIVHMSDEPCACGRTSARIWFHGRLAYLVNVQGRDIFPSEVTDALLQIPEIGMKGFVCELVKTSPETQDRLIVRVAFYEDKVEDISLFRERLEERLGATFGVPVTVEFMEPQEVKSHKVERVVKRY